MTVLVASFVLLVGVAPAHATGSSDATLSALTLSAGTLSPAFSSATHGYTASTTAASLTVTPTVNQVNATVQVQVNWGALSTVTSGSASTSLALSLGSNTVDVQVMAQDGYTSITYAITVTRISTDATLSALTESWQATSLSPTFAPGTTAYASSVTSSTTSITVTPTVNQTNATTQVRINRGSYVTVPLYSASGNLSLNVGTNPIDVKVTAQDGVTTQTYTITVTRPAPPSNDATLSALMLSSGSLSPTFTSGNQTYSASTTVTSIAVTPTVNQANATIQVQVNWGALSTVTSGSASSSLALSLGSNLINVNVLAQDATTTKTYAITVTRISTDATLSALSLSWQATSLSPTFAPGTTAYASSVTSSTTSITVTPTANQTNATTQVRVNGGSYVTVPLYSASGNLSLNVGTNPIDVKVTAQDGVTTQTYTITVTRPAPPSNDATLSALTLSSGLLSPTFANSNQTYSASTAATSITVTPTANQSGTTVQVAANSGSYASVASGHQSGSLALPNMGPYNYVYVLVTAQDGTTTKTYTLTVTRLATDATLSSLVISSGTLSPAFAAATTSYTANVSAATSSITTTPTVPWQQPSPDSQAKIQVQVDGSGFAVVASGSASASLALNAGTNPIDVKVTAQDGSTILTYTITVTRAPSAPIGVTGAAGDSSATVSWTAASGATSYSVTASPGGNTCTATSSQCTVSGLTNGTSYTFTVIAANKADSTDCRNTP